ncbi:hypothetical protein SO3561_08144 [Streptomyces olivochromogenes]|uniref:Uncharacterized protein n=1 Tax=Streptomyces olivochromogenes TaxID=1963 RepID=A0A250VR59_STROL|nr:hypothetical protein SO3561_08144 [Streptomyces olivochromogenes]
MVVGLGGQRISTRLRHNRLLVLTKPLYVAVGDEADGESEECFVDVVTPFPADAQAAKVVQPGDRAPDDVAEDAQAGAVWLVVAAVGQQCVGASARSADQAGDRRDLVEQGQELGDIVVISAGQRCRERDALPVDDDVVLAARTSAVDRAGSAFGPRRAALTWEESITALDQSSLSFDRSLSSSSTCNWPQTLASFQAASRRQQVIPEPKPNSCGRYSRWMPVCSTNRIPHSACRSGTQGLPSTSFGPGAGSNGSMSDHGSSDTIHGLD